MKPLRLILIFPALLTILCCRSGETTGRGFYYWKTRFNLSDHDKTYLAALHIDTIYLRFFDVAWDASRQAPVPVGSIDLRSADPLSARIVPVVFITTETAEKLTVESVTDLARNICNEIDHLAGRLSAEPFDELQLDCDWTRSSRAGYFALITQLAEQLRQQNRAVILTATIRLHQIRHAAETGIPPVARGVLMAYNTSSPTAFESRNAILDLATVEGYLTDAATYPLPLDLALPLFSWAVQYDRNRRFVRLLQDVRLPQMQSHQDFSADGGNRFSALKDTFLSEKRIMAGDFIKLEGVDLEQLAQLAAILKKKTKSQRRTVILFDYDLDRIGEVTHARPHALEEIYATF